MNQPQNINRRAALIGVLASSVALAAPVAKAAQEPNIQQFLDTAEPIDLAHYHAARLAEAMHRANPGRWFCTIDQNEEFALIQRKSDGPSGVTNSRHSESKISTMYALWLAIRDDTTQCAEAEYDAAYRRYADLQQRIVAETPLSARDVAIQFVVETDDGDSCHRDVFLTQMRALASATDTAATRVHAGVAKG